MYVQSGSDTFSLPSPPTFVYFSDSDNVLTDLCALTSEPGDLPYFVYFVRLRCAALHGQLLCAFRL